MKCRNPALGLIAIMGTDSVKLFNKKIADEILAMDQAELITFLEKNLESLRHKPHLINPVIFTMSQQQASVAGTVETLLATEYKLSDLKSQIAQDFAFGDEEIHLDYWGCYVEVFSDHPPGSFSSLDYLPEQEEETFLLLQTNHVEQITKSLKAHEDDLTIMNKAKIEKLEEWARLCDGTRDYYVAYLFDF